MMLVTRIVVINSVAPETEAADVFPWPMDASHGTYGRTLDSGYQATSLPVCLVNFCN